MFPVGNAPFAYLLYLLLLHRSGYHFSAHVPVMRLLYGTDSALCAQERGRYAAEADAPTLPFEPGDLAVEYDGTYDWTFVFERAVELILEEQRSVMTKLEGMSRRRDRLRAIIDADGSMNARQKEVLLEAVLHSNAEFTYDIHMRRYAISYPSARSDFGRLMDLGFSNRATMACGTSSSPTTTCTSGAGPICASIAPKPICITTTTRGGCVRNFALPTRLPRCTTATSVSTRRRCSTRCTPSTTTFDVPLSPTATA